MKEKENLREPILPVEKRELSEENAGDREAREGTAREELGSREERRTRKDEERVEEIRSDIDDADKGLDTEFLAEKITAYVEENLPRYLQQDNTIAKLYTRFAKKFFNVLEKLGRYKVEGRENVVTEGACLMIANHTRLFDEARMMNVAGRPIKIVAADMHFESLLKRFFSKQLGAIEVPGTLAQLSAEEKQAVLERAPGMDKAYYQKVIERDDAPMDRKALRSFLEQTVAALANGEAVAMFPEGLWTYEGDTMREAYSGIETIARRYKKLTGEDLPIQPIAIQDGGVSIAEAMTLEKGMSVHDVMGIVAEILPEEVRGFYGE